MRQPESTEEVREFLRPAIPLALGIVLLCALLLFTETLPGQKENQQLGRELATRMKEATELRESIRRKTIEAEALQSDPIALQREALLKLGYTPGPRDVVLR